MAPAQVTEKTAIEAAITEAKTQGNARFKAHDFDAAKRFYTTAIDAAGGHADDVDATLLAQVYCNRAAACLKLREADAAERDAMSAAQLAPQWSKPQLRLAEVAAQREQYSNAVEILGTALRLAEKAGERAVVKEVESRMTEYKTSATDSYSKRISDHTAGKRPDDLLEYARRLEQDVGEVAEAIKLYERASKMPVDTSGDWRWNGGIGDALGAIAHHYMNGTVYGKNDALAVEYLTRGASVGGPHACNDLGVLYMHGSCSLPKSLALAKDYFRRGAELARPVAMMNLATLHKKLCELETAARWAESAGRYGVTEAFATAKTYRAAAEEYLRVEPAVQQLVQDCALRAPCPGYVQLRLDHRPMPTINELRKVKTPYGRRLLQAKKLMLHACESLDRGELAIGVSLAAQAYRFDDAALVCTPDEMRQCTSALERLVAAGQPMDPSIALVLQPPESTDAVAFWLSLHEQFPSDFRIAFHAAVAHTFTDGEDEDEEPSRRPPAADRKARRVMGLKLFRKALTLLTRNPSYDPGEMDANDLGFWFLSGLALYRVEEMDAAKRMLETFLEWAGVDGHRFAGEAHFMLGLIELLPEEAFDKSRAPTSAPLAAEQLRLGIELQQQLAPIFQPKNKSSNRRMLETALRTVSGTMGIALDLPAESPHPVGSVVRGGELLNGPARHEQLRSAMSSLTVTWKKQRAALIAHAPPPHQRETVTVATGSSSRRPRKKLLATSVDEIVSGVDDHRYYGCVLECIVVAPLWEVRKSSYEMIVEDSRREPIRVVLATVAGATLREQLEPGQIVRLLEPRLRHSAEHTAVLLVRDPTRDLELGDAKVICWNCSLVPALEASASCLQSCSQCHRAKYCSRECQKEDWKLYGHRNACVSRN